MRKLIISVWCLLAFVSCSSKGEMKLTEELSALSSELGSIKTETRKTEKQIGILEAKNKDLSSKIIRKESKIEKLTNEIKELEKKIQIKHEQSLKAKSVKRVSKGRKPGEAAPDEKRFNVDSQNGMITY